MKFSFLTLIAIAFCLPTAANAKLSSTSLIEAMPHLENYINADQNNPSDASAAAAANSALNSFIGQDPIGADDIGDNGLRDEVRKAQELCFKAKRCSEALNEIRQIIHIMGGNTY